MYTVSFEREAKVNWAAVCVCDCVCVSVSASASDAKRWCSPVVFGTIRMPLCNLNARLFKNPYFCNSTKTMGSRWPPLYIYIYIPNPNITLLLCYISFHFSSFFFLSFLLTACLHLTRYENAARIPSTFLNFSTNFFFFFSKAKRDIHSRPSAPRRHVNLFSFFFIFVKFHNTKVLHIVQLFMNKRESPNVEGFHFWTNEKC